MMDSEEEFLHLAAVSASASLIVEMEANTKRRRIKRTMWVKVISFFALNVTSRFDTSHCLSSINNYTNATFQSKSISLSFNFNFYPS